MQSLSDIVFWKAGEYASADALSVRGHALTYAELSSGALAIASGLWRLGAEREVVAIVGQRKVASYLGVAGILFAGCSYTPISPKYNRARIAQIIADAGIRFAVGARDDLEAVAAIIGDPSLGLKAVIVAEGDAPEGSRWLGAGFLGAEPPLSAPVEVGPGALAYVLYTSGSTGVPKGVQVMHSNVLAFLRGMSEIYRLEPGFRASQTFDFSFDPSAADMFFTWTNGGCLCVLPDEEILLPTEYIRRERITFLNLVPSIGNFMMKMGALTPGAFPGLRYTMFCGEQFPKRLADAWRAAAPASTIENLYGPTEATIYISRYLYRPEDQTRTFRNGVIPIGCAFPWHEAALVGDDGARLGAGEVGEIVFRGPQLTKGYLNDAAKTDAVFVRFGWDASGDRWYRTADVGVVNEHGEMECLGRRDNQVKLAGRRVELGEIEAALSRYPQLADIVVVALRDDTQAVVGLVGFTTHALSKADEAFIRADIGGTLDRVFFPKRIISVPSFPLAPSGKTDRKALERMAATDAGKPRDTE